MFPVVVTVEIIEYYGDNNYVVFVVNDDVALEKLRDEYQCDENSSYRLTEEPLAVWLKNHTYN